MNITKNLRPISDFRTGARNSKVVYLLGAVIIVIIMTLLFMLPIYPLAGVVLAKPQSTDSNFEIKKIFSDKFSASNMAFIGNDDFLILDRDQGKVFRVTNGELSGTLLDVNVATNGYRGMLGIALNNKTAPPQVFLYFTEARTKDGDDFTENPLDPLGNRVYRYDLVQNQLVNQRLLLDLPAMPGPRHTGGILGLGPDGNLYVSVGDLDGSFRGNKYQTQAQNYQDGIPVDGRSGILVVSQNGETTTKGILGNNFPLNLYFAYGIRNSFGFDWDPLSGYLWDSENGPLFGDEINLVFSGFNSGWTKVQGFWETNIEEMGRPLTAPPVNLVDFGGRGKYSSPKFVWTVPIAPTALKFLNTDRYGPQYQNDLLVADANFGNIYHFDLDSQRRNLVLGGELRDRIANNLDEASTTIFAKDLGRIADMEIGPDGLLYILSIEEDGGVSVYKMES